jgi:hypothetical protein
MCTHRQNKKLSKLHDSVLGLHCAHNYPLLSAGQSGNYLKLQFNSKPELR